MHCDCEVLPLFTYYREDHGISQRLKPFGRLVEHGAYRDLFRCEVCDTHWRVDAAGDGRNERYVWKVGAFRPDWAEVEKTDEMKALLLQRRGGEDPEECMRLGCAKNQVKGSAYCIDHLFATGTRW